MFDFKLDGTKIVCRVETGISVEKNVLQLVWECNDEMFARLLFDRLQQKQSALIEQIRKEEYNQGWNDKTKRRLKRDWFSSSFKKVW